MESRLNTLTPSNTLTWHSRSGAGVQTGRSSAQPICSLVTLLVYFPYVGFVPGIDVQPFFFLVGAAVVALCAANSNVRVRAPAILCFLLILLAPCVRLLVQVSENTGGADMLMSYASTMFHVCVIVLCAALVKFRVFVASIRTFYFILGLYLFVGTVQLFFPDFMSFAVYRGFQELRETGRGVRSLASEPACFGNLLATLNIYLVYFLSFKTQAKKTTILAASYALVLGTSVLSQSFYAVCYHFLIVLLLTFFLSKSLFAIVASLVVLLPSALLAYSTYFDSRFFYILEIIFHDPVELYEQGAFLRVLNVPISIYGGYTYGWCGSGFDPTTTVFGQFEVFKGFPYNFEIADRCAGGFVELYLRLGLLSIPCMFWYFWMLYRIYFVSASRGIQRMFVGRWAAISIFMVSFLYSSSGNPIIWIICFLFLQESQLKRSRQFNQGGV